jgi:phosphoribosylanthranilate isomerase
MERPPVTRVKICGCMSPADAVAAAEAGADFIGIIFAHSRRCVSADDATEIVAAAGTPLREMEQDEPPPLHSGRFDTIEAWFAHGSEALDRLLKRKRPLVVGVFEDQSIDEVNQIADETGIDLVQLSGSEPALDIQVANRQVISMLRQRAGMTSEDVVRCIEPGAAVAIGLDPSRGSGLTGDWDVAREIASRVPLWLAGGLTAENVGEAIAAVRPWLVDVSSGVETDGAKDPVLMRAFVRAATGVGR